jgi:hypothetical protein
MAQINGLDQLGMNIPRKIDDPLVKYDGRAWIIVMNGVRDYYNTA